MPIAYLTRVTAFTATHRIARADWTEERNTATFGKAAQDHSHHYECRVTVKGPLVADQGGVVSLVALDALLAREISERLEGQHINEVLPEFADGRQLATGEALAVYFWGRLRTLCRPECDCMRSVSRRGPISIPSTSARPEGSRRGRMAADSAVVEEWPVWLEVNGTPVVTWMCTPDQLEELAAGWLHGEGYIDSVDDLLKLRPCATDLGFWADMRPEGVARSRRRSSARAGVGMRGRHDAAGRSAGGPARLVRGEPPVDRAAAGPVQGAVRARGSATTRPAASTRRR